MRFFTAVILSVSEGSYRSHRNHKILRFAQNGIPEEGERRGGREKAMTRKTGGFTRKKLLTLLLTGGVLLLLFFTAKNVFVRDEAPDLNTIEGREAYLKALGWEIDRNSESFRSVVVPQKLEGIMAQYNKIQLKQGLDLNKHLGESCRQYCYDVTNYPGGEGKVIVSLYLQNGQVIAGDVHSTAVNGFMHGLSRGEAASPGPAPSPTPG